MSKTMAQQVVKHVVINKGREGSLYAVLTELLLSSLVVSECNKRVLSVTFEYGDGSSIVAGGCLAPNEVTITNKRGEPSEVKV